jgi:hypothetical protein
MPSAIVSFSDNRMDVDRLIEIHTSIGGSGRGRRWNLEVLHKAAIVLTCSIWEAFVEDLIDEAASHIARHVQNPDNLPKHLKQQIARKIRADQNELSPWSLAGAGWQNVLRSNAKQLIGAVAGKLNTPKSPQLTELFDKSLGMADVTASWRRRRMTPAQAASKLDAFITLRGAIAHRGQGASAVTKVQADDFITLVSELVTLTDGAVRDHVQSVTGQPMPLFR